MPCARICSFRKGKTITALATVEVGVVGVIIVVVVILVVVVVVVVMCDLSRDYYHTSLITFEITAKLMFY